MPWRLSHQPMGLTTGLSSDRYSMLRGRAGGTSWSCPQAGLGGEMRTAVADRLRVAGDGFFPVLHVMAGSDE